MDLNLGEKENLIKVSFDTIGGGQLKQLVDQYIVTATSETLMQKKMNCIEENPIKITIEITVEALDEEDGDGFRIKGKVKKTLPPSSCVSIAVGDELGLYVRKDGREGDPLQESLDYKGENEVLKEKKSKRVSNDE